MEGKRIYKYWVVVRIGDTVIATHLCENQRDAAEYGKRILNERKGEVKIKKIMV